MTKKGSKITNNLTKALISQIIVQIRKYKEPEKIVVFGSRAKGDFKDTSDIDIAIFAKNWTDKDINILKHNLNEFIKTPLKFDLLNFYAVSKPKLKKEILNKGRIIYDARKD
jgi:hypothetical protein